MKNLTTPNLTLLWSYALMVLRSYALTVFFLSAFLLFPGCNYKKNNTLDAKIGAVVATDSLFEPTGDAKLDSLLLRTVNAPIDTNLAKLYERIGDIYMYSDSEKAKEYYLKLKEISEYLNWDEGRLVFANTFGMLIGREGLTDSAIVILHQGLDLAKKTNNERHIALYCMQLGNAYKYKQWFETSLNYFYDAISIFEKSGDNNLAVVYYYMSGLYRILKLPQKAIEYAEKAAAILGEHPMILTELGSVYVNDKQYEKGSEFLEKALEISIQQNNFYGMEMIYLMLAENAQNVFDLNKMEFYINKLSELRKKTGGMNSDFYYYFIIGQLESLKGDFTKSEQTMLKALTMATEQDNNKELIKSCYDKLGELCLAQRKFRNAVEYWEKIDIAEKELNWELTRRTAEELEVKYETEKKQLEIEKQQQINKLQRNYFMGGIAVCILIVALLWFLLRLRNRQKQTLAEMNATKDKFFTIISHDLKNPAVAQREALQMLLENAKLWNPEQLERYYQGLMKSADGLVDLLYNLLNWAQLQTGRMQYKPVLYDIAADMRETAVTHFSNLAEHKSIELITKLPETALITGDINMLKTVIRNLIDNAIKFTPQSGQIILEISQGWGVSQYAPTGTGVSRNSPTRISVSDTGIGMTEEQIRNFLRNDGTAVRADFKSAPTKSAPTRGTAGETGTGLGLSVCKELLEKHGSTLHIESEPGKGSTFWFEI